MSPDIVSPFLASVEHRQNWRLGPPSRFLTMLEMNDG